MPINTNNQRVLLLENDIKEFAKRCKQGAVFVAEEVKTETIASTGLTAAGYAKRQDLAEDVIRSAASFQTMFATFIATVGAFADLTDPQDGEIVNAIRTNWNAMAKIREGD